MIKNIRRCKNMDKYPLDNLLTLLEKELKKLNGKELLDLERIEALEITIETLKEGKDMFLKELKKSE